MLENASLEPTIAQVIRDYNYGACRINEKSYVVTCSGYSTYTDFAVSAQLPMAIGRITPLVCSVELKRPVRASLPTT